MPTCTTKNATQYQTEPTRRLLLVDDDVDLRDSLSQMTDSWGFATTTAGTFRAARRLVATEAPFDGIVCDYNLPDGDGLKFLDWLTREMLIEVPFLLISGGMERWPANEDKYKFLAKPFSMREFHDHLDRMMPLTPSPTVFRLTPAQSALASVYAFKKAS